MYCTVLTETRVTDQLTFGLPYLLHRQFLEVQRKNRIVLLISYIMYMALFVVVLKVESGFFLDCDVKIVGKSIRDRVALIKWRRDRTFSSGNGEVVIKKMQQNLLQVPGASVQQATTLATTDYEDQEAEQQTLICTVPAPTSTTCENLQLDTQMNA